MTISSLILPWDKVAIRANANLSGMNRKIESRTKEETVLFLRLLHLFDSRAHLEEPGPGRNKHVKTSRKLDLLSPTLKF